MTTDTTVDEIKDARALLKRAQAAAKQGKTAEAEQDFRAALTLQPDLGQAALGLVALLNTRGDTTEAQTVLRSLIINAPTHAHVTAAARQWRAWESPQSLRLVVTGQGTLEPLGDYLQVALAQESIATSLYVSGFDQWAQDLLEPDSALYSHRPEVIALRLDAATLFPRMVGQTDVSAPVWEAERQAGITRIKQALDAVATHAPGATVILQTFPLPDYAPLGVLDLLDTNGQHARFHQLNQDLIQLARERTGRVLLLDAERLEARHGKTRVREERLWYMASFPYSESFLLVLARAYVSLIRALKGRTKKCIVLDLDNTLWGGVIGEDGVAGIKVGGTAAPGNAFADFQNTLLQLRARGILLAVCSKNNPEDVWPVFDTHPEMLIRREHIAAWQVGWHDKATGIKAIARELNIGRDSLVFLDDNPAERGLVRQEVPEVLTVELPRDPALYTATLRALDVFEILSLTEEDRQRHRLYQEQQERKTFAAQLGVQEGEMGTQAENGSSDLTAYLRGLEMVVTLAPLNDFTVPRVAQLLGKTNQFNVTTRRHTEAQVRAMHEEAEHWAVWTARVVDRFGDSGLTGVAIVKKSNTLWEIDSFLLSCRVLGRGVEDALMTRILHAAHTAGVATLTGVFIPTAKNAPASTFFTKQGFVAQEQSEQTRFYTIDVTQEGTRPYPEWLTIRME